MNKKIFIVLMTLGFLVSASSFSMGYEDDEDDFAYDDEDYSLSSCGSDIFSSSSIEELIKHDTGGKCLEKWSLGGKCGCLYKELHEKRGRFTEFKENLKEKHLEKKKYRNAKKGRFEEDNAHPDVEGGEQLHLDQVANDAKYYTLEKIEQSKKKYWEQFSRSYEKLTVQASAQAEILQLQNNNESQGFVGCTPRLFTAGVKDTLNPTIEKQIGILKKDQEKLKDLNEKCETKKDILKIFGLKKRQCNTAKESIKMIEMNIERLEALKLHEESNDCTLVAGSLKNPDTQNRINKIIASPAFSKMMRTFVSFPVSDFLLELRNGEVDLLKYGLKDCSAAISQFNQLESMFSKFSKKGKVEKSDAVQVEQTDYLSAQCGDANDPLLCAQMAEVNKNLINKTKDLHTSNADDCITYAEYTAFQGRPSEDFLKALSKSKNPEKLFEKEEGIVFLKSNPLIGMIANGTDAKQLAQDMKKMAKKVLEQKTPAGKFGAYLDFMKGDFAELHKKNSKSASAHVCNELSSIYSAITISNDDSAVPVDREPYSDNRYKKLEQVLNRCSARVQKKIKTSGLDESLKSFGTFLMGSESEPNEEPTQQGFDNLKAEYCQGFAEHKAKNCKGDMTPAECRGGFKSEFSSFRKESTKRGLKDELDAKSFENIANNLDETKQDHEFVKYWEDNIRPQLNKNVLAGPNDRGEFAAAMAQNHAIMSSPDIMTNYENSKGRGPASDMASSDVNSPSNESSDGPQIGDRSNGQQEPDWAKDESLIDPERFSSAKVPQDMIPGFKQLDPIDQKEALKQVKDFVSQQDNTQNLKFDEEDVDSEIKKVDNEIVKDFKRGIKKEKKEDEGEDDKDNNTKFANKANFSPTNNAGVNSSNSSSGGGISSSSGVGGNSVARGGKISAQEKAQLSHRKALLGKYDNQSVDGDAGEQGDQKGVKVSLQESLVNFESVPGLLIDGASELKPQDHDAYLEMKQNKTKLISYLESNLGKLDGPKVIRLQDPQESPHAFLLFYVSQNSAGEYSVRPIKRQNNLKDLNNILR